MKFVKQKMKSDKPRERFIKIGNERWNIGTTYHAIERIKKRCGNDVAIDDVLEGVQKGYVIRERPVSANRTDHGLHVLCKIPFSIKQYYIVVFFLEPFKRLVFSTIYEPKWEDVYPERILIQSMNEKEIRVYVELCDLELTEQKESRMV